MGKIKIIEIWQLIKKLLKFVIIIAAGYLLYVIIIVIYNYYFNNFEQVPFQEQNTSAYLRISERDSLKTWEYLKVPNEKILIELILNNSRVIVFDFHKMINKWKRIEQGIFEGQERKNVVSGELSSIRQLYNESLSFKSVDRICENVLEQFEIRFATKIDSTIEKMNYRIYFANGLPQSFYLLNDERRILSKFKKKYDYFSSLIMVDSPDRFRLYYIINEKDKKPDLNTIFSKYIEPTLLH